MLTPKKTLNLIKYSTVGTVFFVSAGAFCFLPFYTALGLSLGALVGGINYIWLEEIIEGVTMMKQNKKKVFRLTVKYFLRLVLIGTVVCVIILHRRIDVAVTVGGYSIPLFVIFVVGMISIFKESKSNVS